MPPWSDLTHLAPRNPSTMQDRLRAAMRHAESCNEYLFRIYSHHFGDEPEWYTSTETYLRDAREQLTRAMTEINEIVCICQRNNPANPNKSANQTE
jgi:hypothetical protein